MDAPALQAEMKEIEEKYGVEVKEKKKLLKKAAGEQHEEEQPAQEVAEDDKDEEPEEKELPHMLVGEQPTLPIEKKVELKGDKLEKASSYFQI